VCPRCPRERRLLARADEVIERTGAPLLASQEENEWPREDHTNPFAQPERTGIVRVHQKSQHPPGAKVEPDRRTTAPDSRAHAVFFRRRHQPRKPPLAKIRARTLRPRRAPSASSTRDSYKASGSVARRRLRRQRLRIQLDLLRSR